MLQHENKKFVYTINSHHFQQQTTLPLCNIKILYDSLEDVTYLLTELLCSPGNSLLQNLFTFLKWKRKLQRAVLWTRESYLGQCEREVIICICWWNSCKTGFKKMSRRIKWFRNDSSTVHLYTRFKFFFISFRQISQCNVDRVKIGYVAVTKNSTCQ